MKVCEQTVKPRALPLNDRLRRAMCVPHHLQWYVYDDAFVWAFGSTLDEALAQLRYRRLKKQGAIKCD